MTVKLIRYWDVIPEKTDEFDTFYREKYISSLNKNGSHKIVGSWSLAAGGGCGMIVESVSNSLGQMKNFICRSSYLDLRHRLWSLVEGYHSKLLLPVGNTKPDKVDIESGYKLTQHFNVNPGEIYAVESFIEGRYENLLSKYNLKIVGNWKAAVGATPYSVVESRANSLDMIGKMLIATDYQKMIAELTGMVSHFGTKILKSSGHLNR